MNNQGPFVTILYHFDENDPVSFDHDLEVKQWPSEELANAYVNKFDGIKTVRVCVHEPPMADPSEAEPDEIEEPLDRAQQLFMSMNNAAVVSTREVCFRGKPSCKFDEDPDHAFVLTKLMKILRHRRVNVELETRWIWVPSVDDTVMEQIHRIRDIRVSTITNTGCIVVPSPDFIRSVTTEALKRLAKEIRRCVNIESELGDLELWVPTTETRLIERIKRIQGLRARETMTGTMVTPCAT